MSLKTILRKGTNQTIPNTTFTDVEWTTVLIDEGGFYDAAKPAEIVIPAATYDYVEVMYDISWDTNFTWDRYMALLLDGAVPAGAGAHTYEVSNLERGRHCIKCLLPIASGGILKVQVWQNTGANRELVAGNTPIFSVRLFTV